MGDVEIGDIPPDMSTATKDEINQLIASKNHEIERLKEKCEILKKEMQETRTEKYDAYNAKQVIQQRLEGVAEVLNILSVGLRESK